MSLAILAGIVASDGHMAKDKSTICVINKNKEFIEDVQLLFEAHCGKKGSHRFIDSGFGSKKYLLRVNSAKLVKEFNSKYAIPIGRKSDTIMPAILDQKESLDFLCGWIAGDGSVTTDRKRPKIEIWSKSKAIIEWFGNVLEKEGIESRIFEERRKKEFILRVGKKESVVKFYRKARIPHKRKQDRLSALCS